MPGSWGEPSTVLVKMLMLLHGQKMVLSSNWCSSEACSYEFVCMLRITCTALFDPWVSMFIDLFPVALQPKWAGMKSPRGMLLYVFWYILYLIILINNKYSFPTASVHFCAEVPTAVVSCVSLKDPRLFFNVCLSHTNTDPVSWSALNHLKYSADLSHILGWFRKMSVGSELCRHVFGHTALC